MEADFSGYATKTGLRCSDGRTIMPDAFKDCDGQKVPLVWQHGHNDVSNILGHAVLENRDDGVYAYAYFNDTAKARDAREQVKHGDITSLSIYANRLVEKSKQVFHGMIREVSLVISGANPGALIENISIRHSDGDIDVLDDEVVIYTDDVIEHTEKPVDRAEEHRTLDNPVSETVEANESQEDNVDDEENTDTVTHADGKTVNEIFKSLSEEQKNVVYYMVGTALKQAGIEHGGVDSDGNLIHNQKGNGDMSFNIFEQNNDGGATDRHVLSHDDVKGIVSSAVKSGSLKDAIEDYALQHGIENIDIMFPDAKAVMDRPEFIKRDTEWVSDILSGARHSPFSRIKSLTADLTYEEARAKGYIKGRFKKEEFFGVSKRTTGPTTIYKKQKLDRDDIVDITDFDIVAWLKAEMRMMLNEELARAILVGDGRQLDDEDKIKDPHGANDGLGIRSILNDHELYVTTVNVNLDDADSDMSEVIDSVLTARRFYKGSGQPTFYTSEATLTAMLLLRDKMGRRLYRTAADLAAEMRVAAIVPVEVMETVDDLVGIIVNMSDYVIGADKGGEISMFDDFDIDFNQYKYLIETRLSGALTKAKSAMVIRKVEGTDTLAVPVRPAFNSATNTITIPTTDGVTYQIDGATVTAGANVITQDTTVDAVPNAGRYFATSANDSWTYRYTEPTP